ncbi:MAG: DUF6429 family protein [Anaerolineaceae bacterium]|jgi:hypothetical protein|nr:DUF6429 family protein [Anaerolineaceae bacterium]
MEYNQEKVADVVLALLYLNSFEDQFDTVRAWKSFDWDALDRLHERGMISNPKGKTKSVVFTEEGLEQAKQKFMEMFA